ncbi:MAG: hypothetical protein FWE78_01695 [Methanimicrococcus sp.]|nr:hypothetical protein [Methanimicrococcus sp.]
MAKLKQKGMKWLRLFHILTAGIWFGGVVCIGILAYICFFQLTEEEFLTIIPLVPALYQKIMPFAFLTIIQGFIYGFFTNWGFVKHKWVLYKWILTVFIALLTGLGSIRQIHAVIEKVGTAGFEGGFADGQLVLLFIFLQITLMAVMIALSVFKPRDGKNVL